MTTRTDVTELNSLGDLLAFASLNNLLHRLESNINQSRLASGHGAKTAFDGFSHLARLFDFFPLAVECFHDLGILWTRHDVQTGEVLRLNRPTIGIVSWDT